MIRANDMRLCIAIAGGLLLPFLGVTTALAEQRPSVLLIMTDDQGWGDLHAHDNPKIDTPVLDRLAAQGARFERFFVSPVCAPTRASLLTGRYHPRTGVHGVTRGEENMRASEITLAEVFKSAGYATGCFGKWHNGAHYPNHPNGQGFDEFVGFCAGHWNNYFDPTLERNGEPFTAQGFITDVLTDEALAFIEKNRRQPFLCYVPYNAPHSPWQVPDKHWNKYKARGLNDVTACAYAMCGNIDDNVGRLLARLDELGLAENTIVLFLTDNGPNSDRYNGDMRGRKGSVHEGGVRVPLLVRYPAKIKPGVSVKPIAAHIDLLPTLADLCGVESFQSLPLDGRSLAPLLLGKAAEWPARTLFTFRSGRGAARTDRWRAVRERGDRWRLYDMQADPGQKRDVAASHTDVVSDLSQQFNAINKQVMSAGFDPLPIPIGHAERPVVTMPGHEAFLHPAKGRGISYQGASGWANDWVANWTDVDAYPFWEVEVVRPGAYDISLAYVCPEQDVGAQVRVEIGGKRLEAKITKAHDPPELPKHDRIGRKEVGEKVWAELSVGQVTLDPGRTQLVIRALSKPGKKVADVKHVRVRRVE
jgi:arylsulfatase A